MNRISTVAFFTIKLKADFEALKDGRSEEKKLYDDLCLIVENLKCNQAYGTRIPKRMWPKFYRKRYRITNLWKCNLPSGWRLTYTIKAEDEKLICIILEWFSHPEYNRRFGYNDS